MQSIEHRYPAFDQRIRFLYKRVEGEDNAVADQSLHTVAQDARRNQVQHRLLTIDDKCMAGIVAALEACDRSRAIREQVDDLTFAFVTPLRADDNDVFTHENPVQTPARLAAQEKEHGHADHHEDEADVANVIVTQAGDFRHHLAVLLRRNERQHALDDEHQRYRREDLCGYCWPSELFK